jgi:hypothetical protein
MRRGVFVVGSSVVGVLMIGLSTTASGDNGISGDDDVENHQLHDASPGTTTPDASNPCWFTASGGVMSRATWGATSSGVCGVRFIDKSAAQVKQLDIEAFSPELRSVKIGLRFVRSPMSGLVTPDRTTTDPFVGDATVIGWDRVEWVARTRMQGTFRLDLTSIRPDELHGTVVVELPVSNLSPHQGNPLRLLTIRASF